MKNWRWPGCGWLRCSMTRWAKRLRRRSAAFRNCRQETLIEKWLFKLGHSHRQAFALYAGLHLRAWVPVIFGGCAAKESLPKVRRIADWHEHHSLGGARINVTAFESWFA